MLTAEIAICYSLLNLCLDIKKWYIYIGMIANLREKLIELINNNFSSKKLFLLFLAIIFLAFIFRFWGLGQADFLNDDGHYAFRSLGWFDYLGSSQQTTPIQWFSKIPWWANLSFHDHPPLLFFFQWLAFLLFGASAFSARFFIAILNLVAILFFYFLIKKEKNEKQALLAIFLLAISTFAVWISRLSLNDGLVLAFEIMYLYFFVNYFSLEKKYYFILAAIFVGLAIMSKYTAIYILPAAFIYIILNQKKTFRSREFYLAAAGFIFTILPIVICNFFVFISRGHFDASLSHMVGMRPDDFAIIKNKVVNFSLTKNFFAEYVSILSFSSLGYFVLKIIGGLYIFLKQIFRKNNNFEKIVFWHLLFLILMFLFMGPSARYITIIEPFLIIGIIMLIFDLSSFLKNRAIYTIRNSILILIFIFLIIEFVYSVNTNLTNKPFGLPGRHYALDRSYNFGFNQLDKFISENIYPDEKIYRSNSELELKILPESLKDRSVLIYDDRISWFSSIWIFNRHLIYGHQPVFSLSQLFQYWSDPNTGIKELKSLGVKDFWFIVPVSSKVYDANATYFSSFKSLIENTEARLKELKIKPMEIYNNKGDLVFRVYHFK